MSSRQRSRSRSPIARPRVRVSYEQLEALVDYLENNRELATGYLSTTAARYKSLQRWQAAAVTLNSIGSGANKDAKGWSAYWSNYKNKLKAKIRSLKAAETGTGGGRPRTTPLNETEERVVRLLGPTFGRVIPGVQVDPHLEDVTEAETMHETLTVEMDEEYIVEMDELFSGELSLPRVDSIPAYFADDVASQSILSETYSPPAVIAPTRVPSLAQVASRPGPSPARSATLSCPSSARASPLSGPSSARAAPRPSPSPARAALPVHPPAQAAPMPAASVAPRRRRRRCEPALTGVLESAQNAVVALERDRVEVDRQQVRNETDSATALQRVAAAIEAQAEQAAGLTAAVHALAAAHAEQAAAMQALAHAAMTALQHFGAQSRE